MSINIKNRRAKFEYEFILEYCAGIKLFGSEIKSIRDSKASIAESYCYFNKGQLFIKGMHVAQYKEASTQNHEPLRERKLLLRKGEIKKLSNKMKDKGLTIIARRLFINKQGWAKLDIALAKGKNLHDKRNSIKERDIKRDLDRDFKM